MPKLNVDLETNETEIGAQETIRVVKTPLEGIKKEGVKTEESKTEELKTEEKKTEETSHEKEKKYILPYALDNLGPTVLRILGYMPNGEGDDNFFIKPSRDELTYNNRSKKRSAYLYGWWSSNKTRRGTRTHKRK